ncbi:type ISP restriction/modification enzyme [Agrobacterium sp. ES01]|uniref:type ISP restriction/modification enzyme n=1 Tax=Agrobacterium sp. ES01 TaxID=3420714 RepID=UPI003D117C9D
MNIQEFLKNIDAIYKTKAATEHSYRADLQKLLSSINPAVTALNEPKRVKCGAPDFIVSQGDIVIGHVEAKDIPVGIRALKDSNKDQHKRYLAALPNLIYTNCLDWDFYRDGELVASVSIADLLVNINPRPQDFATLENLLREFVTQRPQTITSPRDLAERMAGKANLIKDVLSKTLQDDTELQSELSAQYLAFKENLIHDITPSDFADIYAETIAYGMFAARLHDSTLDTFSRQEALDLLPKSNPFLRSLFSYVAGYDLDDRIAWIIDDLARVFRACDVAKLMEGFGKLTGQNDPFLHFYETFLAAYNPSKRKARGVWYTPEPVVNFIVRAVDEVLQTEFGLADGLADTSKVSIDWDTGQRAMTKAGKLRKDGSKHTEKREVHRVQVLDPATGTGTFLAEVIKQIAPKVQGIAPTMWSKYIEDDLIPRLHGFELLMASYAMCHMKLDMILTELGYKPTKEPPRLSVYLTNSLEEGEPANQTLPFTQWLSREAKGANTIKRDMPIMCVIGNPPYLGEGGVSEGWIGDLMEDYKKEPGGKMKLKERNPKWLNDLYVKFIRLSSHLIEKNGEGVIGFITNHGYIDNPTFRGMRWHLLNTFDRIWVLDLHGNAKKREVTPNGKPDKNVFDIQQGVSIILGVKKKDGSKDLAEVMHGNLWGARSDKYEALRTLSYREASPTKLAPHKHYQMFYPIDNALLDSFDQGFKLDQFFLANVLGFQTHRDNFAISETKHELSSRLEKACGDEGARSMLLEQFQLKETSAFSLKAISVQLGNSSVRDIEECLYRPFDKRFVWLDRALVDRPRPLLQASFGQNKNLCLLASRQLAVPGYQHVFVSDCAPESCVVSLKTKEQNQSFPLYLYPEEQDLDKNRRVNFNPKLWKKLQRLANHHDYGEPDEVQTFDYIYGVLHCPAYREIYAEFLKIDFPRIPWPTTPDEFWDVSAKGAELRKLHLMEPASVGTTPYPFMGEGNNEVAKPCFEGGHIWINEGQYFADAPAVSWDFYIGGYQPAQKWLKDRTGRSLSFEDVKHYQRILKILSETQRIMDSIKMSLQ